MNEKHYIIHLGYDLCVTASRRFGGVDEYGPLDKALFFVTPASAYDIVKDWAFGEVVTLEWARQHNKHPELSAI